MPSQARPPSFRHDPVKLVLGDAPSASMRWDKEPALCGYTKLAHLNERLNKEYAVPVCATAIVAPGAGVIVASYDGRVRLFSADLSETIWEDRLNGPIYATPLALVDRGLAIVVSTNGEAVAFDRTGKRVWRTEIGQPVYASPTFAPGADVAVFCAFGSRCFGLDAETGATEFAIELPRPWSHALGGKAAHRDPYASPIVTSRGHIVVCCAESVLCLSADGTLLWQRTLDASIRASPAFLSATEEVAVAAVDGRCALLDAETGKTAHEWSVDAKVVASPAVSGEFVVFGSADGDATCVHGPTRALAWRRSQSSPKDHSSYSVTPAGDFIATNERGNILCVRAQDGRFLWETSQLLGLAEHDSAMDTTPVAAGDGSMYCGSYAGFAYYFRFQPVG